MSKEIVRAPSLRESDGPSLNGAPRGLSWNYRVIEFVDPSGEAWRAVHEVYYRDGEPHSYAEGHAALMGEDDAAIRWTLDQMARALDRPVLVETDFASGAEPESTRKDGASPQVLSPPQISSGRTES